MSISKLNKRVFHLVPTLVPDGQGGFEEQKLEDKGFFWAEVVELEPRSYELAGKDVRLANYRIKTRLRDINEKDKLSYSGRVLEIDYIKMLDGAPAYIELTCKEAREV